MSLRNGGRTWKNRSPASRYTATCPIAKRGLLCRNRSGSYRGIRRKISAEFIMVYPAWNPDFHTGELITEDNITYIQKNIEVGLPVQGPEDPEIKYLRYH